VEYDYDLWPSPRLGGEINHEENKMKRLIALITNKP